MEKKEEKKTKNVSEEKVGELLNKSKILGMWDNKEEDGLHAMMVNKGDKAYLIMYKIAYTLTDLGDVETLDGEFKEEAGVGEGTSIKGSTLNTLYT